MRSPISVLTRSSAPNIHRSSPLFYRHLTAAVVLLTMGATLALSSLLVGARGESKLGNLRNTKPAAPFLRVGSTRKPRQEVLTRARSFNGDLRDLSLSKPSNWTRPEHEEQINPTASAATEGQSPQAQSVTVLTRENAPDIPRCREIVTDEILDGRSRHRRIRVARLYAHSDERKWAEHPNPECVRFALSGNSHECLL